jgi:glycine hydroxymethyltransferase
MSLHDADPQIADLLDRELVRQQDSITLIPSENHTSPAVLEALSSVISDKYAEGYPGKRYYAGNEIADQLENLVRDRTKALFGVPYANVQPYSGSPANLASYLAVMNLGDTFMGLDLSQGGHLTHGYHLNVTGRVWKSAPYRVSADGSFDFKEIQEIAQREKPKLIVCGGTAIPRAIPFAKFAEVANDVGAVLMADISHIAGLIAGGAHESPVPFCHIITTTTHKTLRGPRGAMILVTQKGLDRDEDLGSKIDKAIIPGSQGGPHLNTIAGIGVALGEAALPAFSDYAKRIVENAQALAQALTDAGFTLVSNGTDNHLVLVDLTKTGVGRGVFFQDGLERIGLVTNKNTIPNEPSSPFYPSGLRLGSPAATTRGMGQNEMKQIASWIAQFSAKIKDIQLPVEKEERTAALKAFRSSLKDDPFYETIREEVRGLSRRYPIPAGRGTENSKSQIPNSK